MPAVLLANETLGEETKIGDTLTLELGERSLNGERLGQNVGYMDEESGEPETFIPGAAKEFTVVGIYDSWPNTSYAGAGYDVLTGPTEEKSAYQDIFIEMKQPRQVFDFAEEHLSKAGIQVMYNESLLRWLGIVDNSNLTTVMGGLSVILIIVIMAGSITLIYNAFSISLRERTVQFGLLSSIGATKKQLRRAMRYEAFFVSVVGIPLGILAGVGGIGVTLHYIGKDLTQWIHGTKTGIPLYVPVWAIAVAAATAFVTIMISVWIPSRRIRKITPMEAIRSSTDIRIRPNEVRTRGWVTALFGLEGMMAQKNYRRDRRKYRATVVSLTMSIGLFTAAGLFNLYLMKTGMFVMDVPETDLAYTLYGRVNEQDKDVREVLGSTEGVLSVDVHYRESFVFLLPEEWVQTKTLGYYVQDFSSETAVDVVTNRNTEGKVYVSGTMVILEDDDFIRFAKQQKADVSKYQDSDHIRVIYLNSAKQYNPETERYEKQKIYPEEAGGVMDSGFLEYSEEGDSAELKQTFQIEFGDAAEEVPENLGEYGDRPVMFLPESMYRKFMEEFQEDWMNAVYGIRCGDVTETYEKLEVKLSESNLSGYLENRREAYETDRNTIIAVKVLTYGFVILISLIAAANVFHTISTNLMLRRKEFAMLRSMGMSPKKFRKMMNYECLIYGGRSLIYGFVFTLMISAALQRSIGAGADVSFLIPWGYLAAAAAGVFGVVFLTMMYIMRVIRRNNIVEELKMN